MRMAGDDERWLIESPNHGYEPSGGETEPCRAESPRVRSITYTADRCKGANHCQAQLWAPKGGPWPASHGPPFFAFNGAYLV